MYRVVRKHRPPWRSPCGSFREFTMPCRLRIAWLLVAAAFAVPVSAASADWIQVQNDTKRVIVVQSAIVVNGQAKRGRPVRLLPGESVKEFHQPPAIVLEVYDPANPLKAVLAAPLAVKRENQKFSVAPSGAGVTVAPVAEKK